MDSFVKEVWKDIKGYVGYYQVSNLGRILSLQRKYSTIKFCVESILKLRKDKYGYLRCNLCRKSKRTYKCTHRLVAEAFIPNSDNKLQVNHKNGIKTDNRVENLEWCTAKENVYHRDNVLGKHNRGENHNLAKLTVADVTNIKLLLMIGVSKQTEIAPLFNISVSHISSINRNKTWRHIL